MSSSDSPNTSPVMADPLSLSLSLQAFPSAGKEKQSLQCLISRINDQKGSFRNVTEQSLEDEIEALENEEAGKSQEEDVVETVEDGDTAKKKKEEVSSAREEILKQVA